ncbi:MAG: FCD domain-containing protein [Anaerolineae bacterium]|nr:FCD domain-containing protein [Thermoflexales bacterium]MDW8394721.1 FCD domain-containing protein [Anaerolineae bacterium]
MTRTSGSELLDYIVRNQLKAGEQLPPLEKLSDELDLSISKLREQLEVARVMGLVEVKPRTGIRVADYDFAPAVRFSLMFALARERKLFEAFSELRNHVEFAFFHEAVALLNEDDRAELRALIARAWSKLDEDPPRIPHAEHRDLHLTIYRRLGNPFVKGLLEAYWDAYEAEGLSVFSDYDYLHEVWTYHEGIVDAINRGEVDTAYRLLVDHTKLLQRRPQPRFKRVAQNDGASTGTSEFTLSRSLEGQKE